MHVYDGQQILDLLSTPAGIGLTHIRGRLDLRKELEDDISDTDKSDNGPEEVSSKAPEVSQHHRCDEDVDCRQDID